MVYFTIHHFSRWFSMILEEWQFCLSKTLTKRHAHAQCEQNRNNVRFLLCFVYCMRLNTAIYVAYYIVYFCYAHSVPGLLGLRQICECTVVCFTAWWSVRRLAVTQQNIAHHKHRICSIHIHIQTQTVCCSVLSRTRTYNALCSSIAEVRQVEVLHWMVHTW